MTNEEIVSEVNVLLQSLKYSNIKIKEISIYHSRSVEVEIEDLDADLLVILTFGYCYYFKGRVDMWTNVNLVLAYTTGFRKLGKRNLPETLFVLQDRASGSFIKGMYLDFKKVENKNKRVVKNEEATEKSYEGTNIDLIRSTLQKRAVSRVRIVNSQAPLLRLEIDNNLSYLIELPKVYECVDLLCEAVIYMNVNLYPWETTQGFTIEQEGAYMVLTEKEHNYQIKCKFLRLLEQQA